MSFSSAEVYSPYELDQLAIKVAGGESYVRNDCVGTFNVERGTRTVSKKCKGNTTKRKTKPTGEGSIEIHAHILLDLYRALNGMTNEGLQPGVYAFDNTVPMPECSITAKVKDEDDNVMYKAFPRCKIEEINKLEITNGSEEVAEVSMKLAFMPDAYNKGEYEALEAELTGSVLTAENWMTEFSSALAQASSGNH